MKQIVRCPQCYEDTGSTFNLAEYLPDGKLSIRTFYKTFKGLQVPMYIKGQDFELICGNCGSTVFRKNSLFTEQSTTIMFGTA